MIQIAFIADDLTETILEGRFREGDNVRGDFTDGKVVFGKKWDKLV